MRRAVILLLLLGMAPGTASAWTVKSGFSPGCHEVITARAFDSSILDTGVILLPLPAGETWRQIAQFVLDFTPVDPDQMDDKERFLFSSLIIGVRAPDTDGNSILFLEGLRQLHSDPSAEGQYAHALRGVDDDHTDGDAAAVAGIRRLIDELVTTAQDHLDRPVDEQIITAQLYLDFYGLIDVPVYAPMYYLGRAAHAVQDTFSHTIRSDAYNLEVITHVFNYVEAIGGSLVESRDGLAHSDSMDRCDEPDTADTEAAAVAASIDFFSAVRARFQGGDRSALEHFLDRWVTLEHGCTLENDFCDNRRWLDVARQQQTGPYLKEAFGCQAAPGSGRSGVVWLLVLLWLIVRRRR